MRQEISLDTSTTDVLVLMAEGNPGAVAVLGRLLTGEGGGNLIDILHLDDMNLRGSQIWIAYKDHCHEDMATFVKAIRARDQAMLDTVNAEGRRGNHTQKAIPRGAQESRIRNELTL